VGDVVFSANRHGSALMLWRVQYKKRMGLVRRTLTEATEDTAIECALRLHDKGRSVLAVGIDATP
jgi:hypothetical protein